MKRNINSKGKQLGGFYFQCLSDFIQSPYRWVSFTPLNHADISSVHGQFGRQLLLRDPLRLSYLLQSIPKVPQNVLVCYWFTHY